MAMGAAFEGLFLLLLTAGCGGGEQADTGLAFFVSAAAPTADEPITQATVPQLTFNTAADPASCTTATIRLDALTRDLTATDTGEGTDHTIDFTVPIQLAWSGEESVQLVHAALLPRGWRYAVTATGGEAGCLSAAAEPMLGYFFTFDMP